MVARDRPGDRARRMVEIHVGADENVGVYVSTETLAIVISAAGLLLGFIAAFAWMIKRSDEQFAGIRGEIAGDIGGLRAELGGLKPELGELRAEFGGLRAELGELRAEFAGLRAELGAVETRLGARTDELSRRVSGVERELVEVKIAIARVEGPPRRLLTER